MKPKDIIELYKTGKYTTKELAQELGVTLRYIQLVLEEDPILKRYGRTREMPIFTITDIMRAYNAESSGDIEEMIEHRYKEHYKKASKKNNKRDINSSNDIVARAKLRGIVLERDGHECCKCKSSICLEVHHIKPVKSYPELKLDPDNCETVCHLCHDRMFS